MPIALRDFNGASVMVPTPPENGRALAAASRPVTLATEDFAALTALAGYLDGVEGLIGSTNTALATLSAFVDGLEALAAAATPAGSAIIGKVGIDQTAGQNVVAVPALARSSVSASANVTAAAANTQLLAANANRLGGAIVNDSTSILYVKLSTGASATSYDYFLAGSVSGVPAQFDLPQGYVGPVFGFWASANGAARVSERTA